MRVKSYPRQITRQENSCCIHCMTSSTWRGYCNYSRQDTSENKNTRIFEPLNLSMFNSSVDYCDWDNLLALRQNDLALSSCCDVALDLSPKTNNPNVLPSSNIHFKSMIPPISSNSGEYKNLFLYKMLTDSNFFENIKKFKHPRLISCEYCKKVFSSQLDLYNHQNETTNEMKNYVSCCACNKTFSQRRNLRYHQRCHSENGKFVCDICTRQYSRLDNLTRHNTFHTNPNKFPCSLCERTFARKDLLNKHIKGHENRYRFHCDLCQRYFKGPISLEKHMKLFHPINNSTT